MTLGEERLNAVQNARDIHGVIIALLRNTGVHEIRRKAVSLTPDLLYQKQIVVGSMVREFVDRASTGRLVVLPDGTVGDITVKHSLDEKYGLDQEAIKAARQWIFKPGTKDQKPVPVSVTLELTFTLKR